jgi:hypothetical protein
MKWQYRTNGKFYNSKFSAISEFEKYKQGLCLETPKEYDNHNFAIEPKDDLTDLLRNEAQKVREENNHLRLFYSGGPDSHAVLNTFIENNIQIDEIVCLKSGIKESDFEIDQFALPYLHERKDLLTKTNIRVLTPTLQDYEKFYSSNWTKDFLDHKFVSTITFFRLIDQLHDFNDGAINIKGKDKPKLILHKGKIYTYIFDVGLEPKANEYNFFLEDPKIHAKQCHLLLKGLRGKGHHYAYSFLTNSIPIGIEEQKLINTSTMRHYTQTDLPFKFESADMYKTIQHNGRLLYYLNQKDRLALEQAVIDRPHVVEQWSDGIEKIMSSEYSKWFNQGRPEYGTIGTFSKFYCLDDNEVKTVDDLYPLGFTPEQIQANAKLQ